MKAFLSFFLISLSILTFSQTERGPEPIDCISGPSIHVLGDTHLYSYEGLTLGGYTPIYTWTQEGTAGVTFNYPNPSNKKTVNVTLNTPGTLCLKVSISYAGNLSTNVCSKCFETCDVAGIENFHGDIQYSTGPLNNITFRTTNYDETLYNYNWSVLFSDYTATGDTIAEFTMQQPLCPKNITFVNLVITKKTDPNSVTCKVVMSIGPLDICSNVVGPGGLSKLDIVFANSTLKAIGDNISNYSIMIFDINSKMILNSELKSEINLSKLQNGTYFYKIIDNNNVLIKDGRFIKN